MRISFSSGVFEARLQSEWDIYNSPPLGKHPNMSRVWEEILYDGITPAALCVRSRLSVVGGRHRTCRPPLVLPSPPPTSQTPPPPLIRPCKRPTPSAQPVPGPPPPLSPSAAPPSSTSRRQWRAVAHYQGCVRLSFLIHTNLPLPMGILRGVFN